MRRSPGRGPAQLISVSDTYPVDVDVLMKLSTALQLQLGFVLKLRFVLKAVIAGLASH
jgi:hypothetical protein